MSLGVPFGFPPVSPLGVTQGALSSRGVSPGVSFMVHCSFYLCSHRGSQGSRGDATKDINGALQDPLANMHPAENNTCIQALRDADCMSLRRGVQSSKPFGKSKWGVYIWLAVGCPMAPQSVILVLRESQGGEASSLLAIVVGSREYHRGEIRVAFGGDGESLWWP